MISIVGRVQNMHRMGLATATVTSDADTDDAKVEAAKKALREASTVCFDVDSTVCIDEGLDELAAYCGVGKEVEDLTIQAMGGSMPFEAALHDRHAVERGLGLHPAGLALRAQAAPEAAHWTREAAPRCAPVACWPGQRNGT